MEYEFMISHVGSTDQIYLNAIHKDTVDHIMVFFIHMIKYT